MTTVKDLVLALLAAGGAFVATPIILGVLLGVVSVAFGLPGLFGVGLAMTPGVGIFGAIVAFGVVLLG